MYDKPHYVHVSYAVECPAKEPSRRLVRSMQTVSCPMFFFFLLANYDLKTFCNMLLFLFVGDTLGMEGNVIERRTSSVQAWGDVRQSTLPSTSTSTPTGVPAYSNIFVTPPSHDIDRRTSPDETSPTSGGAGAAAAVLTRDGCALLLIFCLFIGLFKCWLIL